MFRLVTENYKNQSIALDPNYHYTDEEKKIFDIIYHYTSLNPSVIGESRNLDKNIKDVASLNFPDHIRVIMFLASNTCKNMT